uniref:G-protein coupled receptors family 1 profile domain-containing protein n=1 Tax=Meloidogyne javanica TaxID=6303 RepID=A0A915M2E2_MELJA
LFFIASDNNAYVFLHGPGRWIPSIPLQLLVLVVYLCTLGCSTTSISLQFIDRYLVICRNHSNHFRRYSIMGFIVLLNALVIIIAILAALTSLSMLIFVTLAVSGIFSVIILPFELLLFLPSQWLPVLNPLITIITVHKYRIGFKKLIGLKVFKENSNKQTPVVLPMVQTNNENVVVQERCITPLRNELCQIDRTYN